MEQVEMISLSDAHKKFFEVGACLSSESIKRHGAIIKKHFNCAVAENAMKWEPIEPQTGIFTFGEADEIVKFTKDNQMTLRAHAPIWHMAVPDELFVDGDKPASREILIERIDSHMKAFCEHFKGQISSWDVVNEAINDFPGEDLRQSKWLELIGPDYLDISYHIARKYAPDIQLFYNDYNEFVPFKRERMLRLVKGMLDRGVPLDGMGLQAHVNIVECNLDEYERTVEAFASLGLRIHITEMDVNPYSLRDRVFPPSSPITEEMHHKQAELYRGIFDICRRYSDTVDAVLTWGVADDMTWLDDLFCPGREHQALLFDKDHKIKKWTEQIIEDAIRYNG
ncbi:endo-1,4-beta-xylanase [Paenibacillus prosopidis]|uniref:Beta-xylanase n=1 Tax=Paenibacillus prosopidis TaxID=630520 RepID=A0A368VVP6_9BACL|nr:endo-1,4-beta-xylanase [Paenibacillus prosopidis]